MSGLSRTPGKRVRVNSPPRVRIPPSPPNAPFMGYFFGYFLVACMQITRTLHSICSDDLVSVLGGSLAKPG